MRWILFAGGLGSGKTTALESYLRGNARAGGRPPILIVNDVGSLGIDAARLRAAGGSREVLDLTAGCIDCADAARFAEVLENAREEGADLCVEPTGASDVRGLLDVFARSHVRPAVVTIASAAHYERCLAFQEESLAAQLREADAVCVNRWQRLPSDLLARLLADMERRRGTASGISLMEEELPEEVMEMLTRSSARTVLCGVGCRHHDHTHGHHHGHLADRHTVSLALRPEVTGAQLRDVCRLLYERYDLLRAKGFHGPEDASRTFDVVLDAFTEETCTQHPACATFISRSPIPPEALAMLRRDADGEVRVTAELLDEAVSWAIAETPALVNGDGDPLLYPPTLYHAYAMVNRDDLAPASRERAIRAYLEWNRQAALRLADGTWIGHRLEGTALRWVGMELASGAWRHRDLLGEETLVAIAAARPAHLLVQGLRLRSEEDLANDEGTTENPARCMEAVSFGLAREGLSREEAFAAFTHSRELVPGLRQAWDDAIASL